MVYGRPFNMIGVTSIGSKPRVRVPFAIVGGVLVRASAALWSSAKRGYWVVFEDGTRNWFAENEVVFQLAMVFDEDVESSQT